uniref:Dynein light chain roadblock-type 1 n=8 Tax=Catarrhini TaxID=9526 RepID=A0A7N9CRN8_MACFA
MAEVEETLKRLQSQKGVQGIIVVNTEGGWEPLGHCGGRSRPPAQGCPDQLGGLRQLLSLFSPQLPRVL